MKIGSISFKNLKSPFVVHLLLFRHDQESLVVTQRCACLELYQFRGEFFLQLLCRFPYVGCFSQPLHQSVLSEKLTLRIPSFR